MTAIDTLPCPVCRRPMRFVIGKRGPEERDLTLWACRPCGHCVVQVGTGNRFRIVITSLPEGQLVSTVIGAPFPCDAIPQEYADSRQFFCPICRKQLQEPQPREVFVVRDPDGKKPDRTEVRARFVCPQCIPRQRHFYAVYFRGDTSLTLSEIK